MRAIYKDVNALLVKNGILPKIRYNAKKSADTARTSGKPGEKDEDDADHGHAEGSKGSAVNEQNLFSLLQDLAGVGARLGAAPPGAVVLQGAELLASLTKLQKGDASAIPAAMAADADVAMAAAMEAARTGTTNALRDLKASSFGRGLVQ